jgi:AcrR family transcriptional regulator
MPSNAPDESSGGAAGNATEDSPLRERIMEATMLVAGERGYRHTSVAAVIERYDGYRLQFYREFENLGDAYACAYETHVDRLAQRLLAAGAAAPSWREGLRAALAELGEFLTAQPVLARGLLLQVHVAGDRALALRNEVLERLSRAVDSARRETESRHSPPPVTARFMVSAIESIAVRALNADEPERFAEASADLEQVVCIAYFGGG